MTQHFTMDHLLKLKKPTLRMPFDLSPDGALLALSIRHLGRGDTWLGPNTEFDEFGVSVAEVGDSRVVVVDNQSEEAQLPFGEEGLSWGAQWSPDGRWLVAYVQRQGPVCLGFWERESGACRIWPAVRVRPHFAFEVPRWTPDSQRVLVKIAPEDVPVAAPLRTELAVEVHSFGPSAQTAQEQVYNWLEYDRGDLVLVEVESGEYQYLARNWYCRCWRPSPDGAQVAVMRMLPREGVGHLSELMVISLEGGTPRKVAEGIEQGYTTGFSWSPDSTEIAYLSAGRLYLATADAGSEPRDITGEENIHLRWADVYYNVAPRWSRTGQEIYVLDENGIWIFARASGGRKLDCTSIGRNIAFWVQPPEENLLTTTAEGEVLLTVGDPETEKEGFALLDLQQGRAVLLSESELTSSRTTLWMEAAQDGAVYYVAMEGVDLPTQVGRLRKEARSPSRFYAPNPELRDVVWGRSQLNRWRTIDGRSHLAGVVLPPEYLSGKPLPLLVVLGNLDEIHSFGYDAFDVDNPHVLSGRGYVVLYINLPLAGREPLKQLTLWVLPQIQRLIEEGIADRERIGLYGSSYSGYCALGLLTQTSLFRAGVCNSGMANLSGGQIRYWGWSEGGEEEMGGTLWTRREAYLENSPFFYLDRIEAPLLLVSGTRDEVVTAQAEDVYRALRRLGKRVEWRSYGGEYHFSNSWSKANLRDMGKAVLDWFDAYVR